MPNSNAPVWHRLSPGLILLGCLYFAGCALLLQWLRADLDWQALPLSFYLIGPYGLWLKSAYAVISACFLLIGLLCYRLPQASQRSAAPLLLFTLAAIALLTTTLADTPTPSQPFNLHGVIHGVAAKASFLCLTSAMLLQAWHLHREPQLRAQFRLSLPLACLCFIGLWLQLAPLGLTSASKQKLLVALILTWLLLTGWQLLQISRQHR